jgi:hypothetical protein
MNPKVRRLAVIVGASAALGVAGCGGASTASQPSAARGSTASAQAQPGPAGLSLTTLAKKLGVSESKPSGSAPSGAAPQGSRSRPSSSTQSGTAA